MVPAPPDDIQCRFLVVRQNCAAHIWCWPTSVVMMQSRPPSLSRRSSTCCARRPPFLAYFSGYCLRQAAICFSHSPRVALVDQRQQVLDHQAGVALQADVGADDLVELRRIDVDVDLGGVGAELRQLAGDAVVPAGADGHDQVAVGDRLVGVGGAVHAQHAQVQGLVLGDRALAQQRVHHRRLQLLRQLEDGLARRRRSPSRGRRTAPAACSWTAAPPSSSAPSAAAWPGTV